MPKGTTAPSETPATAPAANGEAATPAPGRKRGRKPRINLKDLSLEELLAQAATVDTAELDEYPKVKDKTELVGVDFVVVNWKPITSKDKTWVNSETGEISPSVFCRVECVASADGRKFSFVDGGMGILPILDELEARHNRRAPFRFPHGLAASEYEVETPDGPKTAVTYYFGQ